MFAGNNVQLKGKIGTGKKTKDPMRPSPLVQTSLKACALLKVTCRWVPHNLRLYRSMEQ